MGWRRGWRGGPRLPCRAGRGTAACSPSAAPPSATAPAWRPAGPGNSRPAAAAVTRVSTAGCDWPGWRSCWDSSSTPPSRLLLTCISSASYYRTNLPTQILLSYYRHHYAHSVYLCNTSLFYTNMILTKQRVESLAGCLSQRDSSSMQFKLSTNLIHVMMLHKDEPEFLINANRTIVHNHPSTLPHGKYA